MKFNTTTLTGNHVRLEPLTEHHLDGLCSAISDGELWKIFVTKVPQIKDIDVFYLNACTAHEQGDGITYAIIDNTTNMVAGSTRFMKADFAHKRVEIGFTFLAKSYQRTHINTEAKLLLLTQAFEHYQLNRVEFLTDYLNTKSRNAILRLGAKQEGILRSHVVMANGRVRDSVQFSILKHEWEGVKQNLAYKLND